MKTICSITGCNRNKSVKGFCTKHYQRYRTHGDALTDREKLALTLPKNCIPLTHGKYAIVDADQFEYLNQWKWHCTHFGYAARRNRKYGPMIYMHTLVSGIKAPDHINRNPLDNRRSNLRKATESQQKMNRGIISTNTSGYKGVIWHKDAKKWKSGIQAKGKHFHLGYFIDKDEAAIYYNVAAQLFHGEFAFQNLIPTT